MQTQPNETVERVARALWVQHTGRGDWWDDPSYAALTEETREGYRGFARAAIAAMHEPAEVIVDRMAAAAMQRMVEVSAQYLGHDPRMVVWDDQPEEQREMWRETIRATIVTLGA